MLHRPWIRRIGPMLAAVIAAGCGSDRAMEEEPVDQAAAPLTWAEQAKLLPSTGTAGSYFGISASISGDTAVVGATIGGAHVFVQAGAAWAQEAQISLTDGGAFGATVAVSGDRALIGSPGVLSPGAAYVFARSGTTWSQEAKLVAGDGGSGLYTFGTAVAVSGDTAVVSRTLDDQGGNGSGSVYVFARSGNVWSKQVRLVPGDGAPGNAFGNSVAVDADTIVVGAPELGGAGSLPGSAYVFVRNGVTWTQQAKLAQPGGMQSSDYGATVAVEGDIAVVGAYDKEEAFVFARNGTTWSQEAKLVAPDGALDDAFGAWVSLSGSRAAIAAPYNTGNGLGSGAAYVFARNAGAWTQEAKVVAKDAVAGQAFGYPIALSGPRGVIGSPYDDDNGSASGSAYTFVLVGGACSTGADCVSTHCVDGVCCDSPCGGGDTSDCQACSMAAGAAKDGICGPSVTGTVCRAPVDACDAAETCDGSTLACPADALAAAGTVCRAAADACDVEEACTGNSITCPADALAPAGTVCRAAADTCDVEEACTGSSIACPADALAPAGTVCRAAAGECDLAETCDGAGAACPPDAPASDGTPCTAGTCEGGVCSMVDGGAGGSGANGGAGGGGAGGGAGGSGAIGGAGGGGAAGTAGAPAQTGGADAGASTSSSGGSPNAESGCGCRVVGANGPKEPSGPGSLAWLALAAAHRVARTRARRRARSSRDGSMDTP